MATTTKSPIRSFFKKLLITLLILIVVGIALTFFVFNYSYSDGNRAGVIIKFSRKGFLMKTYEGELNIGGMGNIPNTAQTNEIWNFSVRDKAMADTIMHLQGRKVSVHYHEVVKAMPWQGETNYFVDGIEVIKE